MKKAACFLLMVAVSFAAACSNSVPEAQSGKARAQATQVDYKKICEHLQPLSPAPGRVAFSKNCESKYRSYLPSCRNAAAVTECYVNIKSWGERLACFDSCVRETGVAQ